MKPQAFLVHEHLRKMQALLSKYSPDQPRVPAGSSAGGQWTSGGANGNQTLQLNPITPDQVIAGSELSYPDGAPVINPNTGLPYPIPEGLNIPQNIDFAHAYTQANNSWLARGLIMGQLFRHGGAYDYQRPVNGSFQTDYIDVTNYNYGAVAAAFGYSKEDALSAAGIYNRYVGNQNVDDITSYGIANEAVNNISQGYDDYHRVYRN